MKAWRDVSNDRRRVGLVVSTWGLTIYAGPRLYRVSWRSA
jgi:hypothetical protein